MKFLVNPVISALFFVFVSCGESGGDKKEKECTLDSDCPQANSYCKSDGICEARPKCDSSECPAELSNCWSDNYCYKEKEEVPDKSVPAGDDFDRVIPGTTTENDS